MKDEAAFKRIFKDSVRKQGGFSLSLAAPMLAGIPDLYCVMPGYLPVLLEAKWLGEVNNSFKRKIKYRPLQIEWIKECHNVVPYSALGLIGLKYNKEIFACLLPYNSLHFQNFSDHFIAACAYEVLTSKQFNVSSLFQKVPIPRLDNAIGYRPTVGPNTCTAASGAIVADATNIRDASAPIGRSDGVDICGDAGNSNSNIREVPTIPFMAVPGNRT